MKKNGIGIAAMAAMTFCMLLLPLEVQAAGSVSIKASQASVDVSGNVTVNIELKGADTAAQPPEVTVTYDKNILQFRSCNISYGGGEGGLITLKENSASIDFTAKTAGSTEVLVEAIIDGEGANKATGSTKITVGSGGGSIGEAGAYLKELTLTPGTLTPEFSPEIAEYTLEVAADITSVAVSGSAQDDDAQITEASGFNNLNIGNNKALVTVKSKEGVSKQYVIQIIRGEADSEGSIGIAQDAIAVENSKLLVSTTFPDEIVPAGFSKKDYTYHEQLVEVASFHMGNLILCYLTEENGSNGAFYIYDEKADEFYDFIQIKGIEERFIVVLPQPDGLKVPAGVIESALPWEGKSIPAWMFGENFEDFYLVYAVSSEGNTGFYVYDMDEGTYQRYIFGATKEEDVPVKIEDMTASPEENVIDQPVIWIVATVLLAAVIILSIVFYISKRGSVDKYDTDEYDMEEYDADEYDTVEHNIDKYDADEHDMEEYDTGEHEIDKYDTVEPDIEEYDADEPDIDEYDAGEHEIDKYDTVEPDIEEYDADEPEIDKYDTVEPDIEEYDADEPDIDEYDADDYVVHTYNAERMKPKHKKERLHKGKSVSPHTRQSLLQENIQIPVWLQNGIPEEEISAGQAKKRIRNFMENDTDTYVGVVKRHEEQTAGAPENETAKRPVKKPKADTAKRPMKEPKADAAKRPMKEPKADAAKRPMKEPKADTVKRPMKRPKADTVKPSAKPIERIEIEDDLEFEFIDLGK